MGKAEPPDQGWNEAHDLVFVPDVMLPLCCHSPESCGRSTIGFYAMVTGSRTYWNISLRDASIHLSYR